MRPFIQGVTNIKLALIGLILSAALAVFFYQSCGGGSYRAIDSTLNSSLSSEGGASVTTGSLVSDCLENSTYNACVINKNVVAALGHAIAHPFDAAEELNSALTFGFTLDGDVLSNPSFIIKPTSAPIAKPNLDRNIRWKFQAQPEEIRFLEQVHVFFWSNEFLRTTKELFGKSYLENRRVDIDTYNAFVSGAGVDFKGNKIIFGVLKPALDVLPFSLALQADVVVELLGELNLLNASPSLSQPSPNTQQNCGTKIHAVSSHSPPCVCKNFQGCSEAIVAGSGYLQGSLVFKNSLNFGETLSNHPGGSQYCGMSTNLSALKNLKAPEAFESCDAKLRLPKGEVHALGLVYAAAWWALLEENPSQKKNLLALFGSLMTHLSGEDTFSTVLEKIKLLDKEKFGGQLASIIGSEFARRKMIEL